MNQIRKYKYIGFVLILAMAIPFLTSAIKDNDAISTKPMRSLSEPGLIRNLSIMTLCPEYDNINVPIYSKNLAAFRIIATHPTYIPTDVEDGGWMCDPEYCKECYVPFAISAIRNTTIIYDDHKVVILGVNTSDWPHPNMRMNVSLKDNNKGKHEKKFSYIEVQKLIEGTSSFPMVFVLYTDGNARIKPQAPCYLNDTAFGSSVIIGASEDQGTQYVEIDSVVIDPPNLTMDIKYIDNTSAHIKMQVDRYENIVEVSNITYDTTNHPFARFRSMWVKDGNADVDYIRTKEGETPIMGGWKEFSDTWWQFFRKVPSVHNTYGPDIKIEIAPRCTIYCS